jgi:hypothetical protein
MLVTARPLVFVALSICLSAAARADFTVVHRSEGKVEVSKPAKAFKCVDAENQSSLHVNAWFLPGTFADNFQRIGPAAFGIVDYLDPGVKCPAVMKELAQLIESQGGKLEVDAYRRVFKKTMSRKNGCHLFLEDAVILAVVPGKFHLEGRSSIFVKILPGLDEEQCRAYAPSKEF